MPCDTTLSDLHLGPQRIGQSILFGNRESYNIATGELRVQTFRDVAEIKRAYSHQIVRCRTEKLRWQLKKISANKYQAIRR